MQRKRHAVFELDNFPNLFLNYAHCQAHFGTTVVKQLPNPQSLFPNPCSKAYTRQVWPHPGPAERAVFVIRSSSAERLMCVRPEQENIYGR